MRLKFLRPTLHGKDILNLLIEINYLAIVFLIPLYFAYLFPTYNIFELNKLVLFKTLVWLLLFFTGLKFIYFPESFILSKLSCSEIYFYFKKYLAWPLIFIFGLGVLLIFSINSAQSFFGSYDRQEGFLSYLFYFIWFFLLFVNLSSVDKGVNKQKIQHLITTAVWSGFIVAFYGILQILNIDFVTWSESPFLTHRVVSTLGQPNFLASFLLLVIPLSLYLIIKSPKFLEKFFYFLVISAQILCLFLTASRGALLALILVIFGILSFSLIKIRWNIFKKVLIILGFLIFLFLGSYGLEQFSPGRISNLLNLQYGSSAVRATFYKVAVSAIAQRPFFGYGLENSSEVFIKYYEPNWGIYGDVNSSTDRAHNLILDILLSGGILGLIFFFFLYYQFFYLAKKNIKKEGFNSLSLFLILGASAYLISLLFSFTIVSGEVYFWLFLAVLSSVNLTDRLLSIDLKTESANNFLPLNKSKRKKQCLFYFITTTALILIVFYGISLEKRTLAADYYFNKLYYILAERKYLNTLVLNNYLLAEKTNKVNQDFYDQFLVEKLSEFYPSINEPSVKYAVKQELIRIDSVLTERGYENILAQAEISGVLGDLSNGQKYFSMLKKITPQWPYLYSSEGQIFFANGKYQEALNSYQLALSVLPAANDSRLKDNNELHQKNVLKYYYIFNREIGNSYFTLRDYQQAEIYYQLAYQYDFSDFTLFKKIADTYYLRGDLAEAIKYNERGLNRSPKDYNWPLAIASLYNELGNKPKALEYLDQALKLAPDNLDLKNLQLEYSRG